MTEYEEDKGIRVNITLHGEPAQWLLTWKQRGLVKSNRDAVVQAFRAMHERLVQKDLDEARLKALSRADSGGD